MYATSSYNRYLTYRRWDNKDGYSGSTIDDCLAHLLSLEAGTWTTDVGCESLAKRLIAFHDDLIWRDATDTGMEGMQFAINQKVPSLNPDGTAPQPAELGQVVATTNTPWHFLLSAAESVTPQAQQTNRGHYSDHGANALSLTAFNPSNDPRAQHMRIGSGAFLQSGNMQSMMQPPTSASLDNAESFERGCDRASSVMPIPSTRSHAVESSPAIPTNFVNTATNDAMTMDDLFVLWQNSAAFSQDPFLYSSNEQSLLSGCDDAERLLFEN